MFLCLLPFIAYGQISSYELTMPPHSFVRLSRSTVYSQADFPGVNEPFIELECDVDLVQQATDNIDFLLINSASYHAVQQEYAESSLADIFCQKLAYNAEPHKILRSYITTSDAYYTFAVNCNDFSVNATVIQEVLNPYGFIPGEEAHMLSCHVVALFIFVGLLAGWTGLLVYYRWATVPIQKQIFPLVLVLNIVSFALQIADWIYCNKTGDRSVVWVMGMLMFSSLNSSLSWFLLFVLSKGWGVSRKTLGQTTFKLLLAAISYYPSHLLYNLFLYLKALGMTNYATLTLASLPLVLLTFALFIWTFKALNHERAKMDSLRMFYKVKVYDHQMKATVLVFVAQTAWYVVENLLECRLSEDDYWQEKWIVKEVWVVIYLTGLLLLMYIWRPNEKSHELLYVANIFDLSDKTPASSIK